MKKVCIILAMLFVICGCKARKVALTRIDSTSTAEVDKSSHIKEAFVDTSKTASTKTVNTREIHTENDSSYTKTTFEPVPGTTTSVSADGTITGQAKSVKTERTTKTKKDKTIDSELQEQAGEIKGISDIKTVDSASTKKEAVTLHKKIKDIDSKPDYSWILWVAGVLALVYLLWRFFK